MPDQAIADVVYRCVCGQEFVVNQSAGGVCPGCERKITAEFFQQAVAATVSLCNLTDPTAFHLRESVDDQFVGAKLGHFQLDECLGRGGMGAVYRALDTSLQRFVAVKVLAHSSKSSVNDDRISRMLQEAISQARMNHPNIVTVYYVGRHGDDPFLAMELVTGGTLRSELNQGPLPYTKVIRHGLEVASALSHALRLNVIHADIKPSNLLIDSEGQVKLSDFGLSQIVSDQDNEQVLSGTPAYLAPELLDGQARSSKSDMYALGVTLFELTFGRYPFELTGQTVKDRLQTHLTAELAVPDPWPKSVPREFLSVIRRLLAKAPGERYKNYEELMSDLRALRPVSTTTAGFALRAMAYMIDQWLLLMTFIPFAAVINIILNLDTEGRYTWTVPFIALVWLLFPTTYVLMVRRGIRSIGRWLFQLRVVDEHGLNLRRSQRGLREVMRSLITFTAPIALYSGNIAPWFDTLMNIIILIFVIANLIILISSRAGNAIHDYICRSKVVLDVQHPVVDRN